MIKVLVYYDLKDNITGFNVSGHAGYDNSGKDIVCAAVSAVVQTAMIGLVDLAGFRIKLKRRHRSVRIIVPKWLKKEQREKADVILKTMYYGLISIQMGNSEYLTVLRRR